MKNYTITVNGNVYDVVVEEATQSASAEAEDVTDDTELVAVIAAAIAEYEGTGTDGFVVRSIRRASKWQRA